MEKIQLLTVENIITRKKRQVRQNLSFFMQVESLSFNKKIDVLWAGEDDIWHTLPATYHSHSGQNQEYWQAHAKFHLHEKHSLPGNIRFALRYQTQGQEYWDNNNQQNYSSEADSGVKVIGNLSVLNISFREKLLTEQKVVPVTVAVNKTLHAESVMLHWTTDDWKTTHQTPCHFSNDYWNKEFSSNARNPNQYAAQLWKGFLKINYDFRLQYSIVCKNKEREFWDNNFGNNYVLQRNALRVLILNLHCYQEDNQDYKFSQIAQAINDLDIDLVCLQEVAELWNDGQGDWDTNSAKIINERLKTPYYLVTDWSHLGFDKYREGVAILSRYPIAHHESRYVSQSHDPYSIHSRKVVLAQIDVPYIGLINSFSSHLSWWEDGFEQQFENLHQWACSKQSEQIKGTLLCGDFNIKAGSKGYQLVVNSNHYDDQYLACTSLKVFETIFRQTQPHWQHHLRDDYRIDYIFMNKASQLRVTSGRVLFTEQDYGTVSDHCGYVMTFEPK